MQEIGLLTAALSEQFKKVQPEYFHLPDLTM